MEWWKKGVREYWSNGVLEERNTGIVEAQSKGIELGLHLNQMTSRMKLQFFATETQKNKDKKKVRSFENKHIFSF